MSIMNYWPSLENIRQCIRTEAEELSKHTLLAVHEPMSLIKRDMSGENSTCSEHDLLETFLKIERPIPIIGSSGVGKSHLIRWLDSQLRLNSISEDWHIVRVPKNASLRQVLEILLDGLEGDEFEQARNSVKSASEKLDTRSIAQLLLTFMRQQLEQKYKDNENLIKRYRESGTRPNAEDEKRIKDIREHAGERGLGSLISDPYFQEYLLKPEHCFYQIAKRWADGAGDDEISDNDYQLHVEHLNFTYNLEDLSIHAREYVRNTRLTTKIEAREKVVEILNEVLGEANQKAFANLFNFNGGSFQDLFKEIRRELHRQGRTLVILIEDMAAISAIEDVLIDSLLEEGMRDGEDAMCPVHSAIAVTEGYGGYVRRQGTILTRATAEWVIEERFSNDEGRESQVLSRIIDFCSRYLNAARHGAQSLKNAKISATGQLELDIWKDESADAQYLDDFGFAPGTAIPLFPLSAPAISAFANKHCRGKGDLIFNPRVVINKILLPVLRDHRHLAEIGSFPPSKFGEVQATSTLSSQLRRLNLDMPERAESIAAIWGYGAKDLEDLKARISANIAIAFQANDLAESLNSHVNHEPRPRVPLTRPKDRIPKPDYPSPEYDPFAATEQELEKWFAREEGIGQGTANDLRNALWGMIQRHARVDWSGTKALPSLKSGRGVKIFIPFPSTRGSNDASWKVTFCSESDFTNKEKNLLVFSAAKALLRHYILNKKDSSIGWRYPQGLEDFINYQNFAHHWLPGVVKILIDETRKTDLEMSLTEHVQTAWQLGVFKPSDSQTEKLNKLVTIAEKLSERLSFGLTETTKTIQAEHLSKWNGLRASWLDLVAYNDYAFDGSIALAALRKALKAQPSRELTSNLRAVKKEMADTFSKINALRDCDGSEEFTELLNSLDTMVRGLQKQGLYPQKDGLVTAQTLCRYIKTLQENSHWKTVKYLLLLENEESPERFWQLCNEVNGTEVQNLSNLLTNWNLLFGSVYPSLKSENANYGGDEIRRAQNAVDEVLTSIGASLNMIKEGGCEHA